MSSKSSSRTSPTTNNVTRNTSTDRRVAADNGAIVVNGKGRVTVVDGGAIKSNQAIAEDAIDAASGIANIGGDIAFDAFGFAERVSDDQADFVRLLTEESFDAVSAANRGSVDILAQTLSQDRSEGTQIIEQVVTYGSLTIVAVAIAWSMRK